MAGAAQSIGGCVQPEFAALMGVDAGDADRDTVGTPDEFVDRADIEGNGAALGEIRTRGDRASGAGIGFQGRLGRRGIRFTVRCGGDFCSAPSISAARTGIDPKAFGSPRSEPNGRVHQPEPEPPDPVLARMVPMTIWASPAMEPRNSTVSSDNQKPIVRPRRT